jgi:hypothetical protein
VSARAVIARMGICSIESAGETLHELTRHKIIMHITRREITANRYRRWLIGYAAGSLVSARARALAHAAPHARAPRCAKVQTTTLEKSPHSRN